MRTVLTVSQGSLPEGMTFMNEPRTSNERTANEEHERLKNGGLK